MVVEDPVDVVQDQGHLPTVPALILAAEFADRVLQLLSE
jgi:hypothetical protein